tara:strand:- start:575 stop:1243 length:669 start_codon:yes stop_codon:yes gene_type:complete
MFFYSGQKPQYEDYFPEENGMFCFIEGLHFPNEWEIYSYLFEPRFFLMDMNSVLSIRDSRMILSFDKFANTCSNLALINRQSAKFFKKLMENTSYYKMLRIFSRSMVFISNCPRTTYRVLIRKTHQFRMLTDPEYEKEQEAIKKLREKGRANKDIKVIRCNHLTRKGRRCSLSDIHGYPVCGVHRKHWFSEQKEFHEHFKTRVVPQICPIRPGIFKFREINF